MSFKENRELESLPETIEKLEKEQESLMLEMSDPAFFKRPIQEQQAAGERSQALPQLIEAAYARWTELTEKAERCAR